jgi:DNA transformation protein
MLAGAGIASEAALRACGTVRAYRAVQQSGARPSLNLLWALEGALTDCDWQTVAHDRRTALLMQLDDLNRGANNTFNWMEHPP